MQSPVQLRLNVRLLGSLFVHGFSPLEQRSIPFGFVPTDFPLIVPPSHSLQPRLQPTDIHRHVCLLVVQKRQRRVSGRWVEIHCVRSRVARTNSPNVTGGGSILACARLPPDRAEVLLPQVRRVQSVLPAWVVAIDGVPGLWVDEAGVRGRCGNQRGHYGAYPHGAAGEIRVAS